MSLLLAIAVFSGYFIKGLCGFANMLVFGTILSFSRNTVDITPFDLVNSLGANTVMAIRERRSIRMKIWLPYAAVVIVGCIPGVFFLKMGEARLVKFIFGIVVVVIGLDSLLGVFRSKGTRPKAYRIVIAVLSGILCGLYGVGALLAAAISQQTKDMHEFRANLCIVFLCDDIFRTILYSVLGIFTLQILKTALMLYPVMLAGLFSGMMWVPLKSASPAGQYIFYVLMYMLFSTGFTIVMVPYNGLLPDMVEDYAKRSSFTAVRMIFSSFGAILAGLIPSILIKDNTNSSQYLTVALIFGALFTVVILITFFGTWEKQKEVRKITMKESFTQSFTVYKSRTFRLFLAIFLCGQGAADFVTGLAVYYVDDVLNAYGGGRFTYLMAVILLSQFVGMIAFTPVISRTSKTFPIKIGFPIRIAATLAMIKM